MEKLSDYTKEIKTQAKLLGFEAIGFVNIKSISKDFENFYKKWLRNGFHGTMSYLERNAQQRFNPESLLENAQSAIVVLAPYYHIDIKTASNYKISRYALGKDYHYILKTQLRELLKYIQQINNQCQGRAFTDSAPVPERYLAHQAGLGFIGKNGMLIHPQLGSYTFIGVIYIDKELEWDTPLHNYSCGECSRCIQACPDHAIIEPGIVDSNHCISYKTIEHKGSFETNSNLRGYIFGCDICQMVCPYNQHNKETGWKAFRPAPHITALTDNDWKKIGSSKFKKLFKDSVIFRTGLKKIRRNINEIESD